MRQWKSLVALHASTPSCFPHPPSPSPCPSPPRDLDVDLEFAEEKPSSPPPSAPRNPESEESNQTKEEEEEEVVRLVGCDGRVRAYRPPVTARELMQQHPRHLVCRADALLIGEKIPAVAAAEELQPGQAYFLLPAHLFRSVLSFVSLASSLLLLLSSSTSSVGGNKGGGGKQMRPFELCRTASGTLQIKFSDDFLLVGREEEEKKKEEKARPAVLCGDARLQKEYEELVGYSKSRRWAPKLEPIQEVVVVAASSAATGEEVSSSPISSPSGKSSSSSERRKSRGLPFLGRLGSRRRRSSSSSSSSSSTGASLSCNGGNAVACSG